jgi:hypothetical protein
MEHITTAQSLLPNHATTITVAAGHTVNSLTYWQIGGGSRLPASYGPPIIPISGGVVDMQDGDPVRRVCLFQNHNGTESVCSPDGTLGVVLPIWDSTDASQGIGQADAFPTTTCTQGIFGCAPALRLAHVSGAGSTTVYALCPDGTDPNVPGSSICPANTCLTPQTGPVQTPNYACLNTRGNVGATNAVDGRVYNLTVWKNNVVALYTRSTGQCAASAANTTNPTPMYRGAFFRLHQNFVATNATAGALPCKASSASDQISCLVQASPCSIAYGDRSAVVGNTVAINVNDVAPSNACIQNLLLGGTTYPMARKLYFNTIAGFQTLPSGGVDQQNEYKLAKCFARCPTLSGSAAGIAVGDGFVPLPNNTAPFCDDVGNNVCLTGSACAGNPAGIPSGGYPGPLCP